MVEKLSGIKKAFKIQIPMRSYFNLNMSIQPWERVHGMCQQDWTMRCTDIWLNIVLGVSTRMFFWMRHV